MKQVLLIHQNLLKKADLANLKSDGNKLDIDQLKNAPGNVSYLKSNIDKLDVDKLVPVSVELSKLNDRVKNDVVTKDVHDGSIQSIKDKIPNITNLATNTILNAKINEVKKEIASITNLGTTTFLNANINEVQNKISNITNLDTTIALTAVENKIPYVIDLVKKNSCNTKIKEIGKKITDYDHDKYIGTAEFNMLTAESFAARLAQANLASKIYIANFVKKANFDIKQKMLDQIKIN